eukprot:2512966-Pyramimonas_sp.AAC.1
MVRRCHGMAEAQDHQAAVVVDGRVHVHWVPGVCGGGFLLANLYLEAGAGLNLSKVSSLKQLARRPRQCRREYV